MNTTLAAVLSVLTLLAILAVIHVPLGTWIHRIFTDPRHTRVERFLYRLVGVDPDVEQRWSVVTRTIDEPGHRVQRRRVVRHEHQLAVVRR